MFKKGLVLAVILAMYSFNCYADQIESSWVGGESSSWEQASNWDPAIVPDNNTTNTFIVTIDGTGGWKFVELTQNHTITKLYCFGEVDLVSCSWYNMNLTVLDGLTSNGDVSIDDLDITGNVSNDAGGFLDSAEHFNIYGNLYNAAGAKLNTEEIVNIKNGNFVNDGSVSVFHESEFCVEGGSFTNNGMIQIKNGTIANEEESISKDLVNTSSGSIWGVGNVWSEDANIVNEGNITASSGNLVLLAERIINTGTLESKPGSSLYLEVAVGDVNNQGNIIVNPGSTVSVKLEKLFTEPNDCALNNVPNGTIQLLGGVLSAATITQAADANFTGFGTISGDVTIETNGLINLTGPTNILGDVTIESGATLEIKDGQTLITGQTLNNGTIELIGGTVIFQGGYSGAGTIPITAGTDRNHFDVNSDGIEDFKDFASFAKSWLWQASWY